MRYLRSTFKWWRKRIEREREMLTRKIASVFWNHARLGIDSMLIETCNRTLWNEIHWARFQTSIEEKKGKERNSVDKKPIYRWRYLKGERILDIDNLIERWMVWKKYSLRLDQSIFLLFVCFSRFDGIYFDSVVVDGMLLDNSVDSVANRFRPFFAASW